MHSPLVALKMRSGALVDLSKNTYAQNQWRRVLTEIQAMAQAEVAASQWITRRDQIGAESQRVVRSVRILKHASNRAAHTLRDRIVNPTDVTRVCDDMAAAALNCGRCCTRISGALAARGGTDAAQTFDLFASHAQTLAAHARALRVCSI